MLLYGYFHGNVMSTIFKGGGMPFWEYYGKFFEVNKSILICAVAICPILLWDTLRVTHRIAGPIVRFKDVLKRLTEGEKVTKIELRDNDLMEDLRDAFNEFLASRANTESIRSASRSAKDDAIDQVIDGVARQTEELKEITSAS